jgi:hypothetical protein
MSVDDGQDDFHATADSYGCVANEKCGVDGHDVSIKTVKPSDWHLTQIRDVTKKLVLAISSVPIHAERKQYVGEVVKCT